MRDLFFSLTELFYQFSQTEVAARAEVAVVILLVALPVTVAVTNVVLDHIRAVKKDRKLSFLYRWQHSKFRKVLVKNLLKR